LTASEPTEKEIEIERERERERGEGSADNRRQITVDGKPK